MRGSSERGAEPVRFLNLFTPLFLPEPISAVSSVKPAFPERYVAPSSHTYAPPTHYPILHTGAVSSFFSCTSHTYASFLPPHTTPITHTLISAKRRRHRFSTTSASRPSQHLSLDFSITDGSTIPQQWTILSTHHGSTIPQQWTILSTHHCIIHRTSRLNYPIKP